jgi:hypothetical protein
MSLLNARELAEMRAEVEAEMISRRSIWRRPPDEETDTQQGAHQLVHADVPCFITAFSSRPLMQNPYRATYADTSQEGTNYPLTVAMAMEVGDVVVTLQPADLLVAPDGGQETVMNVGDKDTDPICLIAVAQKVERQIDLTPEPGP